ncbi:unnamed protein product [Paramecium primaurelia]|uniref:Uncharacterized protein n=1 Tax=Paramecium primaurelia TaxID=5886 RepID=A0A8S1JR79_PARPR|nr:unnamed protein product [Paramecium primaurelia]
MILSYLNLLFIINDIYLNFNINYQIININQISKHRRISNGFKIIQVFISLEEHQKIKYFTMEIKKTQQEHTMITQIPDKDSKQDGIQIKPERETPKLQEKSVKIKEIHIYLHIKHKHMYQLSNKIKKKNI